MGLIGVKMKEAIILSYPLADCFEFRACLAEKPGHQRVRKNNPKILSTLVWTGTRNPDFGYYPLPISPLVRINRSTQYTQYTDRCTYRCAYKVPSIKKSFLMRENLNFYYSKIFFSNSGTRCWSIYNGSKLPNSI